MTAATATRPLCWIGCLASYNAGRLPGELVLDPFCGSGSTGVACLEEGRRFLGIEADAQYAQIARERLAQDTLFGGEAA